jgi:hypothetical protein
MEEEPMAGGTHEHLEHAEHARHAADDPFDRDVAMTMTVVAALLAVVTLLSHRAHTETLRLTTVAAVYKGRASDEWNYYQAKNVRRHAYQTFSEVASFVGKEGGSDALRKTAQARWDKQLGEYKDELPAQKLRAEELDKQSEAAEKESIRIHARADRYDFGELFVELALILSSIAVLTRRKPYWIAGIVFAVVGVAVAATGFLI